MKSVIFTYYSNRVSEIFYHNVKSLILNSEPYDELIICSQVEVPVEIITELSDFIQVTHIYPTFAQSSMSALPNVPYSINPFITSALTYQEAGLLTVFDPHLFLINQLPVRIPGANQFYRTHSQLISPDLFTITPSTEISQLVNAMFSRLDFYSPGSINQFGYIVSNSVAFSNKVIDSSKFIFSQPQPTDQIVTEKLFALDLLEMTQAQFDKVAELRAAEIDRTDLSRLPKSTKRGKTRSALLTDLQLKLISSYSKKLNRGKKKPGQEVEKMEPLVISYYADQPGKNYYRNFAEKLKAQFAKFEVRHDVVELQSKGSYSANCLLKPGFILEKLIEHKEPLIWMDCDTFLKAPFNDFNSISADIGMTTHTGDLRGITASPILFNYTANSFKIIREWNVHCLAALEQGITELDHDALKHYVLPALGDNYSMHIVSDNWMDFTKGYYIVNGNSVHENKQTIFSKVNQLTDSQRWAISKNSKRYDISFESTDKSVFDTAYSCLMNFSNSARIRFFFNRELSVSNSKTLKRLKIESGDSVFFGEPTDSTSIKVEVNDQTSFEKNWDISWKN